MEQITPENAPEIFDEAFKAAAEASKKFFDEVLMGQDQYPCGFARVHIPGIKRSTKLGKTLVDLGIKYSEYEKSLYVSNPSRMHVQNMYCLEAGAVAFAEVIRKAGLKAYAKSIID